MEKRRNYKQFCGLARALDRLGERWTLLIIRNLLLGPQRYTDLLEGLPGITTNLLAARLRDLEAEGLIVKRAAAAPVRAVVYELSPSGRALEPALMELARWGNRFMSSPGAGDTVNIGWGLLSLKRRYRGGLEFCAEVHVDERVFALVFERSGMSVTEASAARPDVVVKGSLDAIVALFYRGVDPRTLRKRGLEVSGSEAMWRALCKAFAPREPTAEEIACQLLSRGVLQPVTA